MSGPSTGSATQPAATNPVTAIPAATTDPATALAGGAPGEIASTEPATAPQAGLDETAIAGAQQDRIVDERALAGAADPWKLLPIHVATTKLNWTQVDAQLEPLPSGTVALIPTTRSGWVKVVVGSRPETSTFYTRVDIDVMYAEPGSLALDYGGPAPPPPDPLARVHLTLDVMGLAPVVGGPADVANTVLYAVEGDAGNAVLSGIGVIPGLGEAAVVARHSDEVIQFGSRSLLRSTLNPPSGLDAHHMIPWELRYHELVQAAAQAGFDMNDVLNGIELLELKIFRWPAGYDVKKATLMVEKELEVKEVIEIVEGVHANHPAYNFYVLQRLQDLLPEAITLDGMIDPNAARDLLEGVLIPELKRELEVLAIPLNDRYRQIVTDNGWLGLYEFYSQDSRFYRFIHGDFTDPY